MKSKGKQLIMAIVLFILTFGLVQFYIDAKITEISPGKLVNVVLAKRRIQAGSTILQSDLKIAKKPEKYLPKSYIKSENLETVVGQETNVDILESDYVLESYFGERSAVSNKLSAAVQGENVRAISLPVDETNSLARSIVSGDHIDIVFTFMLPGMGQRVSTVLLQNVPVVSTGSYSVADRELGGQRAARYNTLTVLLNSQDAVRLNYARQAGKINILLRNESDTAVASVAPIGGVLDILNAEEREMVIKLAQASRSPDAISADEKLRGQLKEILDKQRTQGTR